MSNVIRKIEEIEKEMAITKKSKANSPHRELLKAKLAKLKREVLKSKGGSAN